MSVADALAHINAAIAALSYDEAVVIDCRTGRESELPEIQRCIAEDLQRLERCVLPRGSKPSLIGAIADSLRQAFVELIAARQALAAPARAGTIGDSDGDDGA